MGVRCCLYLAVALLSLTGRGAESGDLRALIPYAGPKSVVVEGNVRRYDKKVAVPCSRFPSKYTPSTHLLWWERISDADLMSAVQSAWHFLRYRFAQQPLEIADDSLCSDGLYRPLSQFPRKRQAIFEFGGEISTNISVRVFPFKVTNSASRQPEYFCLVTFYGEKSFLGAVYENVSTGETSHNFRAVTSRLTYLTGCETCCPFLTAEEFGVQEGLFPRKAVTPSPQTPPRWSEGTNRLESAEVDVDL